MNAPSSIDPAAVLHEHLAQASPDQVRELLSTFIDALLSADADAVCGAGWGQVSSERVNRRNGYRHRDLDTRVGTIDVAVPKLRTGSYFPEWLLTRRRRGEQALTSVVATCYLLGVSTRRMDKLVQSLGITSLSRSQVSEMGLGHLPADDRRLPRTRPRQGPRLDARAHRPGQRAEGADRDHHARPDAEEVGRRTCWPTSTGPAPATGRPRPINGRLEHLRGSQLGFRNLTKLHRQIAARDGR